MFKLVCQPCGASVMIDGPEPKSSLDLLHAAAVAKWRGVPDTRYHRCAVFCSDECQKAATTKDGWLRRNLGSGSRRETKEARPSPAAAQPVG